MEKVLCLNVTTVRFSNKLSLRGNSAKTVQTLIHLFFLTECRTQADIAFLLDGSGSVDAEDFGRMKLFVKNLVQSFLGKDTKV